MTLILKKHFYTEKYAFFENPKTSSNSLCNMSGNMVDKILVKKVYSYPRNFYALRLFSLKAHIC